MCLTDAPPMLIPLLHLPSIRLVFINSLLPVIRYQQNLTKFTCILNETQYLISPRAGEPFKYENMKYFWNFVFLLNYYRRQSFTSSVWERVASVSSFEMWRIASLPQSAKRYSSIVLPMRSDADTCEFEQRAEIIEARLTQHTVQREQVRHFGLRPAEPQPARSGDQPRSSRTQRVPLLCAR